jgi:membrane-associated phospholipid phosphatase
MNLFYFTFFSILACFFKIDTKSRSSVFRIGSLGIILVFLMRFSPNFATPRASSIVRDWFPFILMLLAYRQSGFFYSRANEPLQRLLLRCNPKFCPDTWITSYFELAYLLCYPMIPAGLAVLYAMHLPQFSDGFWTAVLPPTYLCYAMVPFTQTLPPRSLEPEFQPRTHLRTFNLWILRHGSIQINTLPSAHVAASLAVSLFLFKFNPALGNFFLAIAISIIFGAFLCRYHYLVDVLVGAMVAVLTFFLLPVLS